MIQLSSFKCLSPQCYLNLSACAHLFILFSQSVFELGADLRFLSLVGQMEAEDYAKNAFQWAKALRLLDPNIKLVSCGGAITIRSALFTVSDELPETGYADWDRVILRKLAPVVDFHSVHCMLFLTYIADRFGTHVSSVVYTASKGMHIANVMGRGCRSFL